MSIKHWPEMERPREKLLSKGPQHLSDAELLAVFLRTGIKGKTAVDLARELLNDFGDLRSLLCANREQFCQAAGLGNAKFAQLQAVLEMAKRHQWQTLNRQTQLSSPADTLEFLRARLRDCRQEVFACLFLDTRHRIIKYEELFRGTIDSSAVYPREIIEQVLGCQASAVIFSHNHPSGFAQPSQADVEITLKLQKALKLIDVRMLDHIIIADNDSYSFAENGRF